MVSDQRYEGDAKGRSVGSAGRFPSPHSSDPLTVGAEGQGRADDAHRGCEGAVSGPPPPGGTLCMTGLGENYYHPPPYCVQNITFPIFGKGKSMRVVPILLCSMIFAAVPANAREAACDAFDGASLTNSDDEFIGVLGGKYDKNSVFNEYGKFGSEYQADSIWDQYGKNGSEYQAGSVSNKYSSSPPRIVKGGRVIGLLSANKNLRGAVNANVLAILCYDFTPPK